MKNVVVFGGSGFLGSHVSDKLIESGYTVTVFDKSESNYLNENINMVIGNILSEEEVQKAVNNADIVFNFAGLADIDASLDYMLKNEAPACVSVCKSNKPPYWHFTIEQGGKLKSIFPQNKLLINRQELPVTYMPNGALYIAKTKWFKKTKSFFTESTIAYIMPAERSIDIDSQLDFNYAELLLNNQ